MFHRTRLLLLHARTLLSKCSSNAQGRGGDWGRGWGLGEKGGGEGVAQKQQWMVHPLCLMHTVGSDSGPGRRGAPGRSAAAMRVQLPCACANAARR